MIELSRPRVIIRFHEGFDSRRHGDAGYVGVGRVTGFSTPQTEFCVNVDGKQVPASDVLASKQAPDDPEKMEHFVPIEWAETVPEDIAIDEPGLFGNRNTVCAPKSRSGRPPSIGCSARFQSMTRSESHGGRIALGSIEAAGTPER